MLKSSVRPKEGDAHPVGALPNLTQINCIEVVPGDGARWVENLFPCVLGRQPFYLLYSIFYLFTKLPPALAHNEWIYLLIDGLGLLLSVCVGLLRPQAWQRWSWGGWRTKWWYSCPARERLHWIQGVWSLLVSYIVSMPFTHLGIICYLCEKKTLHQSSKICTKGVFYLCVNKESGICDLFALFILFIYIFFMHV